MSLKDYATGTVATAPSPATSGTTLILESGEGARFPTAPFNVTAHPDNEFPTLDNAEKLLVTDVTSDTLTITRAQGDTTAKSIDVGWRISNSLFKEDLEDKVDVTGEAMTGKLTITQANNANDEGFRVTQNDTTNNPRAMTIVNAGTGYSLKIDHNGTTGAAVDLTSAATNNTALGVTGVNTTLSTTKITNSAAQTTGGVLALLGTSSSRTSPVLSIENSGTAGMSITSTDGSTSKFTLSQLGNILTAGYTRVGSMSAPNNTTAGDLTSTRLSVGNGGLGTTNGEIAYFTGTSTSTASSAVPGVGITYTMTPASNSSTNFRALNFLGVWNPGTGITQTGITAGYFDVRARGDGLITTATGLRAQPFAIDSSSASTTQATNVYAFDGVVYTRPSGTSTATIGTGVGFYAGNIAASAGLTATTVAGFQMTNPGANTITNLYGMDIASLTRGGTNNIGLRIAAPSGATNNFAIHLSDTGGTEAGGITFGGDTVLYRRAANTLTTPDVFEAGQVEINAETVSSTDLVLSGSTSLTLQSPSGDILLNPGNTSVVIPDTKDLTTDLINETTAAAGVTIDSVLLKDGKVTVTGDPTTDLMVATKQYVDDNSIDSNNIVENEVPGGTVNGSNAAFTTASNYVAGSLKVYKNGVRMKAGGADFTEGGNDDFTMVTAPATGTVLLVDYMVAANGSGNADTVDGYHANATPTASQIPVLNSSAQLPTAAIGLTAGADASASLTLGTGVTITDSYLTKINNLVILTGFFAKTSFSTGDTVCTLPVGYRPVAGLIRAAAHGGAADKTGRVEVTTNGIVIIRNPSATTNACIFTLVFPAV